MVNDIPKICEKLPEQVFLEIFDQGHAQIEHPKGVCETSPQVGSKAFQLNAVCMSTPSLSGHHGAAETTSSR